MTDTLTLGQEPLDGVKAHDDDLVLWSVTTIIGCLSKDALMYWAAEQSALSAIHQRRTWQAMLEEHGDTCPHLNANCPVVAWLRDARFRQQKSLLSASDLGTVVHKAIEEYSLSGKKPNANDLADIIRSIGGDGIDVHAEEPVVEQMVYAFDRWAQAAAPVYQAAEVVVYSPTYGYAGQTDAFLTLDGVRLIVDYKTTREARDKKGKPKGPYPEVALQLAGYRFAEAAAVWRPRRTERYRRRYYLLSPEERAMAVPVPEVDGGIVIHITPEACQAFPVRCDEAVFDSFLYVLEAARWHFEMSKQAIGAPLITPEPVHDGDPFEGVA